VLGDSKKATVARLSLLACELQQGINKALIDEPSMGINKALIDEPTDQFIQALAQCLDVNRGQGPGWDQLQAFLTFLYNWFGAFGCWRQLANMEEPDIAYIVTAAPADGSVVVYHEKRLQARCLCVCNHNHNLTIA
jgi:hypothetical protein